MTKMAVAAAAPAEFGISIFGHLNLFRIQHSFLTDATYKKTVLLETVISKERPINPSVKGCY